MSRIVDSKTEEKRAKVALFSLEQARKYSNEQNFSRSFAHYLVFAQLDRAEFRRSHIEPFLDVTEEFIKQLKTIDKHKIKDVYEEALTALPDNCQLLTSFGSHLFICGNLEEAEVLFRKALDNDPKYLEAKDRLENLLSSNMERWHFPMLNDVSRNSKFQAAISRHVTNEGCKRVLDIGTGTGLLSLMSAKSGAETVYACEVSKVMLKTAGDVIRDNEDGDKIKLIPKLSVDMDRADVPEKVSLVVTETFDCGLLGEHVLETVHHALLHFLEDGGKVIPGSATFYIAPVQSGYISRYSRLDVDSVGYLDWNVRVVADWRLGDGSSEPYQSENLSSLTGDVKFLSKPQQLFSISFTSLNEVQDLMNGKMFENEFICDSDGECDAIVGWFDLNLDETVTLSTSIDSNSCWGQLVFPLTEPHTKVYKTSEIKTTVKVMKHIEMQDIQINHNITGNGIVDKSKSKEKLLSSSKTIQQLNSNTRSSLSQWVAYYIQRDVQPTHVLDLTLRFPDISLQVMKLNLNSHLTMMINADQRRESRQMLDLVTRVAGDNNVDMARIDCVTSLSQADDRYNVVFLSPVCTSGRINTECLLELEHIKTKMNTNVSAMFIPHSIQLWCVVVESIQMATMSHLVSDDNVMGFKISDHVNKLSVTHQQEVYYDGLAKTELSDPVHVTTFDLSNLELRRQEHSINVPITSEGKANCVVYWFVQDFGWNIMENTKESEEYKQAAFMCSELNVHAGDNIELKFQSEKGLIDLQFKS